MAQRHTNKPTAHAGGLLKNKARARYWATCLERIYLATIDAIRYRNHECVGPQSVLLPPSAKMSPVQRDVSRTGSNCNRVENPRNKQPTATTGMMEMDPFGRRITGRSGSTNNNAQTQSWLGIFCGADPMIVTQWVLFLPLIFVKQRNITLLWRAGARPATATKISGLLSRPICVCSNIVVTVCEWQAHRNTLCVSNLVVRSVFAMRVR